MEIDRNIDLSELVERAKNQNANKNLSWRPYRVSVPEIIAIVEDGGEFSSYFSSNGKQSILISYGECTFIAESSELFVFLNPEGPDIVSRYIH